MNFLPSLLSVIRSAAIVARWRIDPFPTMWLKLKLLNRGREDEEEKNKNSSDLRQQC